MLSRKWCFCHYLLVLTVCYPKSLSLNHLVVCRPQMTCLQRWLFSLSWMIGTFLLHKMNDSIVQPLSWRNLCYCPFDMHSLLFSVGPMRYSQTLLWLHSGWSLQQIIQNCNRCVVCRYLTYCELVTCHVVTFSQLSCAYFSSLPFNETEKAGIPNKLFYNYVFQNILTKKRGSCRAQKLRTAF